MSSKTFAKLAARDRKLRSLRGGMLCLNTVISTAVMFSSSIALENIVGRSTSLGDAGMYNLLGILAFGITFTGIRELSNKTLRPVLVSAEDFDSIEDEVGGFDRTLLEMFQRSNGSRPMPSYGDFTDNALQIGSSRDFDAAIAYLEHDDVLSSKLTLYDVPSVRKLIDASHKVNQLTSTPVDDENKNLFDLITPSRFDRLLERPIYYGAGLLVVVCALSVGVTTAVFHIIQ